MAAKTKKAPHLIYIRNLQKTDNNMLDKLEEITKKTSNAHNILWAGHELLISRKKNADLTQQVQKLQKLVDGQEQAKEDFRAECNNVLSLAREIAAEMVSSHKSIDKEISSLNAKLQTKLAAIKKSNPAFLKPKKRQVNFHSDFDDDDDRY